MTRETKRLPAARWSGLARWSGSCVLLLAALGAAADDVAVSMTAVAATKEDRESVYLDKGLEQVREALASLKNFDTFRKVKSAATTTAADKEVSLAITAECTLYCTPHSTDDSGRVLTSIRIEKLPKDKDSKPVVLVKLSIRAVPGDPITIVVPNVDDPQLVVVLVIGKK